MHRRGHKKSRNGCLECKRRHMKCDESRPQCANCTVVQRLCQYPERPLVTRRSYRASSAAPAGEGGGGDAGPAAGTAAGTAAPVAGSAGPSPAARAGSTPTEASTASRSVKEESTPSATSPVSARSRPHTTPLTSAPHTPYVPSGGAAAAAAAAAATAATAADASAGAGAGADTDTDTTDAAVNVAHAELAFHFSMAIASPDLDADLLATAEQVVLDEAIKTPYLLHQCLALSARHLSTLGTARAAARRDDYLRLAVQLQTRAIALFNATQSVDGGNCVASLLFSTLLGRQALVDVLSSREGGLVAFLDRFVQSAQLQKGIRVVSKLAWAQLLESPLRPLVQWGSVDRAAAPVGHHCDELLRLIALTTALAPADKEACRTAISFLQRAFDNVTRPTPGKSAHQLAFVWGVYLSDEFCALLAARQPEAVAILAWYAVLLHQLRGHWQIADAGAFLLQSVSDFLGAAWAPWLAWPVAALRDGLAVDGGSQPIGAGPAAVYKYK